MQKGELFTVNGNKRNNDRSYTSHIWRVIEEDECHIWAIAQFGDFWSKGHTGDGKPVGFLKRDYDFMPCHEDVLANLIEAAKEPTPSSPPEREQAA